MKRLANTTLPDPLAERVRQDHARALAELQAMPAASLRVISGVTLKEGIATPVPHGLGRPAAWVQVSCPRPTTTSALTTGRIEEVRAGAADRSSYCVLTATGWGQTITVDVLCL